MRRSDLGYWRLHGRCWDAHVANDLPALLELARDPQLSPDMLATIAPDARDHDAPAELIHLVLDHPSCGVGVAGRFATHPDQAIRLRVAHIPGLLTSTLAILAIDADFQVRAAAIATLTERADTISATTPDCGLQFSGDFWESSRTARAWGCSRVSRRRSLGRPRNE